MQTITNQNFSDLIRNAQPEQIPTFNAESGDFKGFRFGSPSRLTVSLNDASLTDDEFHSLPLSTRAALSRDMTTANSGVVANASKPNTSTWKHMILASGVLARAGTSFDTSGNFEGTPFFPGFDSHFETTWLGEDAELPEQSASTISFPYSVHTVGAFSIASRRFNKLAPQAFPQIKLGQAIAIKNAVEQALIAGNKNLSPDEPDGLLVQLTEQVFSGADSNGLIILSEAMEVLEGNGLDKESVAVLMSPDVAKKFRQETGFKMHPSLSIPSNKMLVSKYMPSGTLVAGRYSDYQAVTGSDIEFLAHSYTPEGVAETGATRIRSLFDVDAKVLNQDSFVKVTNIN